jgi:hypothetical protein
VDGLKKYHIKFIFSSGIEFIQEMNASSADQALRSVNQEGSYTFEEVDGATIYANMNKVDCISVIEYKGQ